MRSVLINDRLKVDAHRWNSHQLLPIGIEKGRYGRLGYERVWLIAIHFQKTDHSISGQHEGGRDGIISDQLPTSFFLYPMFPRSKILHRLSSSKPYTILPHSLYNIYESAGTEAFFLLFSARLRNKNKEGNG